MSTVPSGVVYVEMPQTAKVGATISVTLHVIGAPLAGPVNLTAKNGSSANMPKSLSFAAGDGNKKSFSMAWDTPSADVFHPNEVVADGAGGKVHGAGGCLVTA